MKTKKEVIGLGKRIRKFRSENNLSIEDLARKIGISNVALHSIETAKIKNPSVATVADIAKIFNLTTDELVGDKIKSYNNKNI